MSVAPITRVYVVVCRRDFHLARLCVASIRYWHPDIPVTLIPDFNVGEFDTRTLERDWNVDCLKTGVRLFGFGFSKLEALFLEPRERYLIIDADIVLVGPLLNFLDKTSGDFVVHPLVKTQRQLD